MTPLERIQARIKTLSSRLAVSLSGSEPKPISRRTYSDDRPRLRCVTELVARFWREGREDLENGTMKRADPR